MNRSQVRLSGILDWLSRVKDKVRFSVLFILPFFFVATLHFSCFKGITYLLVYRTDKYKKLTAEVEKDSKRCKF